MGETVRGMGVEHQILTLDWDEMPHEKKVQTHARLKRYGALLEACQERDVGVLMMAHHQDDKLGVWGVCVQCDCVCDLCECVRIR